MLVVRFLVRDPDPDAYPLVEDPEAYLVSDSLVTVDPRPVNDLGEGIGEGHRGISPRSIGITPAPILYTRSLWRYASVQLTK